MTSRPRRTWVSLVVPALLAFAVLIALGTWQIERKAWKEGLIASLTERLAAPPEALPAPQTWQSLDRADDEYRHVKFNAEFDYADEALVYGAASAFRPDVNGPGYWVFTPARLAGGGTLIVNRGFVPENLKDAKSRREGDVPGMIEIAGTMRWGERNWFTPKDEPAKNLWFARDPLAIAAAKGLGPVAPFYVEEETPIPPGGWPRPGKIVANLPDNHLQYAITWYGLALVLAAVFGAWALSSGTRRGSRRDATREP
jgi:surfeit locus 1 family protein